MTEIKKFRFRKFPTYGDGLKFNRDIKEISKKFPKKEQSCLTSQLWQAGDSIILNIAEGTDRGTDKDFTHFLNNSHTSLNEVVACLDLALGQDYISEEEHRTCLLQAENLANQITAFRKELLKNPTK